MSEERLEPWQQPVPQPAQPPVLPEDADRAEPQPVGDDRDRAIAELRAKVEELQASVQEKNDEIIALMTEASLIADVVRANNEVDPERFQPEDKCVIIDEENRYFKQLGVIQTVVDENGSVQVELSNGLRRVFQVGTNGEAQIKLIGKDDGTNVVITVGGEHYEVFGIPGLELEPGNAVKVNMKSKQIIGLADIARMGEIALVHNVLDENTYEVIIGGQKRVVLAGPPKLDEPVDEEEVADLEAINRDFSASFDNELLSADAEIQAEGVEIGPEIDPEAIDGQNLVEVEVKEGDRLLLDRQATVVIRHLPSENNKNKLTEQLDVDFNDIAGCENAKREIREAVLYPVTHSDLYEHFGKKQSKGILLYGTPGNGKTLLGKALTKMLRELHGGDATNSGFIYVKGPELLDKWVGSSEQQIRALFRRGEEHYEKHGYPCVMFIDEAEALIPMRGRRSDGGFDIADTTVPMFLSEMDGLNSSHVLVVLATNRPNLLDPAAIREGRCDVHIKVDRPEMMTSPDYFAIHMKDVPLEGEPAKDDPQHLQKRRDLMTQITAFASAEIFSKNRTIYKLTDNRGAKEYSMCLGDIISGSMIQGIVQEAVSLAMRRNMANPQGEPITGTTVDDYRAAVENVYRRHIGQNHQFDVEDFCEKNQLNIKDVTVTSKAGDY